MGSNRKWLNGDSRRTSEHLLVSDNQLRSKNSSQAAETFCLIAFSDSIIFPLLAPLAPPPTESMLDLRPLCITGATQTSFRKSVFLSRTWNHKNLLNSESRTLLVTSCFRTSAEAPQRWRLGSKPRASATSPRRQVCNKHQAALM